MMDFFFCCYEKKLQKRENAVIKDISVWLAFKVIVNRENMSEECAQREQRTARTYSFLKMPE